MTCLSDTIAGYVAHGKGFEMCSEKPSPGFSLQAGRGGDRIRWPDLG